MLGVETGEVGRMSLCERGDDIVIGSAVTKVGSDGLVNAGEDG